MYDYEYFLKDHLGSIRAVFHKNEIGNVEVLQEIDERRFVEQQLKVKVPAIQKHYYPFGMEIGDLSFTTGTNLHGFGGKENEPFNELDYYDFHARNIGGHLVLTEKKIKDFCFIRKRKIWHSNATANFYFEVKRGKMNFIQTKSSVFQYSYDAQLGRWNSPDILMEMYTSESPYSFSGNNPVNNVDPSGMSYYSQKCGEGGS